MDDMVVSVAEFKANLSRILAESRQHRRTVIVTSRKRPIATVVPYVADDMTGRSAENGLASIAGTWSDLEQIAGVIDGAHRSRDKDGYREVPL